MENLNFIISGLYTFLIIAISGFLGYLIGSKEFKKIVELKIEQMKQKPVDKSGAIKQIPPDQRTDEAKEFDKRIKELGL